MSTRHTIGTVNDRGIVSSADLVAVDSRDVVAYTYGRPPPPRPPTWPTPQPWALLVAALQGHPWPALPPLPGRRHVCADRGLTEDELQGITSATELALVCGITRQAALQRLEKLTTTTTTTKGTP